jgi:O-antigen/teichoic acid export membrane protein
MSRLRLAIHGVTSGYLMLVAMALYALGSVPVALHYLDRERFGLWALLASLVGYLSMIDLGMSSSIARHLVDVKDDRKGGSYGSAIKTGWLVLIVQGGILLAIGIGAAETFSRWMEVPPHLTRAFQVMVWLQCAAVAFGFATKIFHCLLLAHQRMDIANYGGILGLIVNFLTLWICFVLGADVFSLIFAGFVGSVASSIFQLAWCCRLAILPESRGWGRVSGVIFRKMFNYGRDVFLVVVGSQLIMTSQTIIIARMIGLEAAAVWSIATRTFTLVGQAVWRVSQTSLSALAEMIARGEHGRLRDRFSSLAKLANSLGVYCAVAFALCNSPFVSFWTAGKITWAPWYDVLLGAWLIVLTWLNSNGNLVLATKKIFFMKYVYFLEGAAFVVGAIFLIKPFGLAGMLLCSIVCSILFSGSYSAWRIANLFEIAFQQVTIGWAKNAGLLLAAFGSIAALGWWTTQGLDVHSRLVFGIALSLLVGFPLFLRLGVPNSLKSELALRTPKRFAPFIERALGCAKAGI